jgi:hypothetical protein
MAFLIIQDSKNVWKIYLTVDPGQIQLHFQIEVPRICLLPNIAPTVPQRLFRMMAKPV